MEVWGPHPSVVIHFPHWFFFFTLSGLTLSELIQTLGQLNSGLYFLLHQQYYPWSTEYCIRYCSALAEIMLWMLHPRPPRDHLESWALLPMFWIDTWWARADGAGCKPAVPTGKAKSCTPHKGLCAQVKRHLRLHSVPEVDTNLNFQRYTLRH